VYASRFGASISTKIAKQLHDRSLVVSRSAYQERFGAGFFVCGKARAGANEGAYIDT